MRIAGAVLRFFAGWTGGVRERAEPSRTRRDDAVGFVESGENLWHRSDGRLELRGGARVATTFAENTISEVVGVWPFSPTGALAICYSATNDKHYAYALTATGAFALPAGAGTESGSRVDLAWNGTVVGTPIAVELFEQLYVADANPAAASRYQFRMLAVTAGALTVTSPQYDLADPAGDEQITPYTLEQFASHLFIAGYDSEIATDSPHMARHSYLGIDPALATGFDPDAYSIIGAIGQPIRAMKAGPDMLMIAKESELYRVTGSGRALPGWQFALSPIDASEGFGCTNARALSYAEGQWYGVGRAGPWRSDGQRVESLMTGRSASWAQVHDLDVTWVSHHPRRRAVMFAFSEADSALSGAQPTVLWTWDLERDCWAPNQRFPSRLAMGMAVAQEGGGTPVIPNTIAQLFNHGWFDYTAMTIGWVNGDTTAQTELWLDMGTGEYLAGTAAAGYQRMRLTGLAAGKAATIRLRHRNGDQVTAFSSTVAVYTRIPAPANAVHQGSVFYSAYGAAAEPLVTWAQLQASLGVEADLTNATSGTTLWTLADQPVGVGSQATASAIAATDEPLLTDVYAYTDDHPVGYDTSPFVRTSNRGLNHISSLGGYTALVANAPLVTQQLAPTQFLATSAVVSYIPHWTTGSASRIGLTNVVTYSLEIKPVASGAYTAVAYANPSSHNAIVVPLTALTAGEEYLVRVVMTIDGVAVNGAPTSIYTRLPVPTATIATAGAGTPVVNVTVTPPAAGYSIYVTSSRAAADATYTNVATTPATYQYTAGTCGVADRYFVFSYKPTWPESYQYSDPVELDIVNPCAVAP